MDRREEWPLARAQHVGSVAGKPVPSSSAGSQPSPGPRRAGRIVAWALGFLVVAVVVATLVQVPYYAVTPGAALDVSRMITVPKDLLRQHRGGVDMVDVTLVPLRAIDYPYYALNGDDQVLANAQVLGTATAAQYDAQGAIDMADARQAATIVALSTLGYRVRAVPDGVTVYDPLPHTGASARLSVGDIVTAIDGHSTMTLAGLTRTLKKYRPGATVAVMLRGFPGSGAPTSAHVTRIRLGAARSVGGFACLAPGSHAGSLPPAGAARSCLGVVVVQRYKTVGLPFSVTIDSQGIIGPSAGLAFTLGLLDELDHGSLTGGRRIAATGTMAIDGAVGDVGGVAQKAVAARKAGATVFFVPPGEYPTARAHAGPTMRVEAVANLQQAVRDLERLGGHLRAPANAR